MPPGDVSALIEALQMILARPDRYDVMRAQAAAWAQQFSLEGLREALRELLMTHWSGLVGGAASSSPHGGLEA